MDVALARCLLDALNELVELLEAPEHALLLEQFRPRLRAVRAGAGGTGYGYAEDAADIIDGLEGMIDEDDNIQ